MSSVSTSSITTLEGKNVCYIMTKAHYKRFTALIDRWKINRTPEIEKAIQRLTQRSNSITTIPIPKKRETRNGVMWNSFIYFEGDQ